MGCCGAEYRLKFIFRDPQDFHQLGLHTDLQYLIAVKGYGRRLGAAGFDVHVVTALDARQSPAVNFGEIGQALAGDGLYTAMSRI